MVDGRNVGGVVHAGRVCFQMTRLLQHPLDGFVAVLGQDDLLLLLVVLVGGPCP